MMSADATSGAVRSPKTAELVAGTLRRMIVDGQLQDGDFLPFESEPYGYWNPTAWSRFGAGPGQVPECASLDRKSSRDQAHCCSPSRGPRWPM
jgi:hypothetical protein